jgi:hypothetical protein
MFYHIHQAEDMWEEHYPFTLTFSLHIIEKKEEFMALVSANRLDLECPQRYYVKDLVSRMVLLGSGRTLKRWGLVESLYITGSISPKETVGLCSNLSLVASG